MPFFVIPFPLIDPVLFSFGPLVVRWYALAYIAGFILGLLLLRRLVRQLSLWGNTQPPTLTQLDDLLLFVSLGVVIGGRIGHVLIYDLDFYLQYPLEIFKIWNGGMSFHGGIFGALMGLILCARYTKKSFFVLADCVALVAPIGLFLGRLANFIKPELWGRVSDVSWAMVFPGAGPLSRHPSQLYEAGLEGLLLFLVLAFMVSRGAFRSPGLLSGVFAIGYGLARIFCEFFREPELPLFWLPEQVTVGMLLSLPLILVGLCFIWRARRVASSQ